MGRTPDPLNYTQIWQGERILEHLLQAMQSQRSRLPKDRQNGTSSTPCTAVYQGVPPLAYFEVVASALHRPRCASAPYRCRSHARRV